jgi:uncharacterized protein (DUF433 family)
LPQGLSPGARAVVEARKVRRHRYSRSVAPTTSITTSPHPSSRSRVGGSRGARIASEATASTDLRNQPAYSIAEAARFVKVPPATLRTWTLGRAYPVSAGQGRFQPLIRPASARPPLLSFWNLIEAHVLRALRSDKGVALREVRQAIRYAEKELEIERLLLSPELRARAGELFLERYGELINLSRSGQIAMRHVLEAHLVRIEWSEDRFPMRLHPFLSREIPEAAMPVVIDPAVQFGRPIIAGHGISTAAIVARVDAGEQPAEIAADYGMSPEHVEQAMLYERAA